LKNLHLKILAALLITAGIGTFLYRHLELGFPLVPSGQTGLWKVGARISFDARGGPVKATFYVPYIPPNFVILDEDFASYGYGLTRWTEGENRPAVWAVRRARGRQSLYFEATVLYTGQSGILPHLPDPRFPSVPGYREPYKSAALALLDSVRAQSADVATFTAELLVRLGEGSADENVQVLLGDDLSEANRVRTAVHLLAGARIPSRILNGVYLREEASEVTVHPWLCAHNGQRWVAFDPSTGKTGLPENFLVWWTGDAPPLHLEGAAHPHVQFSVARSFQSVVDVASRRAYSQGSRLVQFSPLGLPLHIQNVYRVLFLVPVGVLVVVFMRNVIGVTTTGTFMPVLIALAFRETRLLWGIALFVFIVALGLAIRFYLERLKLLVVPRVAAVLVMVILLMAFLSILSHRLGLESGLSVALFPMVILAWTIERMSVVREEEGMGEVLRQGAGSLFVASVSYLCMANDHVKYFTFVYPELHLVVLAVLLLLGRYTGYRLSEWRRFGVLSGESS
jgi:hypothetical protein